MARPTPPGFNKADVIAGLRTAMTFGAPNSVDDRATFCWVVITAAAGADESGVPFSPAAQPTKTLRRETVSCAVDYTDGPDRSTNMGTVQRSRIVVTLLDPDWQKVEPFEYVVWGGDKYLRRTHTIDALGSLDVHTIYCVAEDES